MSGQRISIFPLPGAILFPGMQLPLHIFEPRYRAMVSDALARDRLIGMVQPRGDSDGSSTRPALFDIGCLGRIADVEALADGCFNLVLEGVCLFRIMRELDVVTPFRQVEAERLSTGNDGILSSVERASLEHEAKRFAIWLGYRVDWDAIGRLDDETFVNVVAQVAPFDVAAKQALVEAPTLSERADLAIQLMRFMSSRPDPDSRQVTLQ